MKMKGFTLIELLAVIVILAIIALIATPIVLGIIDDTKESAQIRSAEMYLKGVSNAVMKENLEQEGNFRPTECIITNEGNLDCDDKEGILEVEVDGEKPKNGTITFEEGKIKEVMLNYKDVTILKDDNGNLIYNDTKIFTVKELKEKYDFTYYSTLEDAINVANSEVSNIDAVDEKDAEAGVYVDENGRLNVVLLKDVELNKRLELKSGICFNLGGNILTINIDSTTRMGIYIDTENDGELVTIDGRLNGSTIKLLKFEEVSMVAGIMVWQNENAEILGTTINIDTNINGNDVYGVYNQPGGKLLLSNCNINIKSNNDKTYGMWSLKETDIYKTNINIDTSNKQIIGICVNEGINTTIKNSNITLYGKNAPVYGIYNSAAAANITLTNTNINAYSNLKYDSNTSETSYQSFAFYNKGIASLNDCNMYANFQAVYSTNSININGGLYTSYEFSVIYGGNNYESYIQNATFKRVQFKEKELLGYDDIGQDPSYIFKIGGNNSYGINIYMNNCKLQYEDKKDEYNIITISGENESKPNNLYMSNCIMDNAGKEGIRIDNSFHRFYLGKGNNFNISAVRENVRNSVLETNQIYTKPE